jgi:hypothetical protein
LISSSSSRPHCSSSEVTRIRLPAKLLIAERQIEQQQQQQQQAALQQQ